MDKTKELPKITGKDNIVVNSFIRALLSPQSFGHNRIKVEIIE